MKCVLNISIILLWKKGVIHRDIKPDNCILTKADDSAHNQTKEDWMANDALWDDRAVFDEKEWTVVLVDFGFAKALTPAECKQKGNNNRSSVRNLVQLGIEKQESQQTLGKLTSDISSERSNSERPSSERSSSRLPVRKKSSSSLGMRKNDSFQRIPIRAMSALGTRAFAAPEVTNVRRKSDDDEALTENVSDYGLIADAFSIGATIKVILTGVPADQKEMEFMSSKNNILLNVLSAIFGCGKSDSGRKKRYKFLDETPKPARALVGKLMKPKYSDRLTVPLARDEPWIKGGVGENDPVVVLPTGDVPAENNDPIKCLVCASKI